MHGVLELCSKVQFVNNFIISTVSSPDALSIKGMDSRTAIAEYLKRKFVVSLTTKKSRITHYWKSSSLGKS